MVTAAARTDESGRMRTSTSDCSIGLSGHGGGSASCFSEFKKDPVNGWNAKVISDINSMNPAGYNEMLKVFSKNEKVKHQNAYVIKINKKGKTVKSSLGHYITARSKGNDVSVLINGFSCMFFINDKKVTYLWSGLK